MSHQLHNKNKSREDKGPWYTEPWPWLIMLGPFLTVVACGIFLFLSMRYDGGVVYDDYYKRGKMINEDLGREDRAHALAVQGKFHIQDERVEVWLSSKSRTPNTLRVHLIHPTHSKQDHQLTLTSHGQEGHFSGNWPKITPNVRWWIHLEDPDGLWRIERRVLLPQTHFTITAREALTPQIMDDIGLEK